MFLFLELSSFFVPLKNPLEGGAINLDLLAELVKAHYDSYLHTVGSSGSLLSASDMYLGCFAVNIDVLARFISNKANNNLSVVLK